MCRINQLFIKVEFLFNKNVIFTEQTNLCNFTICAIFALNGIKYSFEEKLSKTNKSCNEGKFSIWISNLINHCSTSEVANSSLLENSENVIWLASIDDKLANYLQCRNCAVRFDSNLRNYIPVWQTIKCKWIVQTVLSYLSS